MNTRPLGRTGLEVSPLGFGAFKIGRNQGAKYERAYELPDESRVGDLLDRVLGLGINYIDTAPAYGLSEERLGRVLADHPSRPVISTKVGETFQDGVSRFDFSAEATRESVERSGRRLGREILDVVLVHSDGRDLPIQDATGVVETLLELKAEGRVRAIGFSGKTVDGARRAIEWADVLNVLRLQLERMQGGYVPSLREYNRIYGVSSARLERAPKELLILHPGPMNRGVEIDSDVADGPDSVILDQVTNGIAVRMAVLYLLAGGAPEKAESAKGGVEE